VEIIVAVKNKIPEGIKISTVSLLKILSVVLVGLGVVELLPCTAIPEETIELIKPIIGIIFFGLEMYFVLEWRNRLLKD
jgi:hypothetical protein